MIECCPSQEWTQDVSPEASQGNSTHSCLRLRALGLPVWRESLGQTRLWEGRVILVSATLKDTHQIVLLLLLFPSHSMEPPWFYLMQQKLLAFIMPYTQAPGRTEKLQIIESSGDMHGAWVNQSILSRFGEVPLCGSPLLWSTQGNTCVGKATTGHSVTKQVRFSITA